MRYKKALSPHEMRVIKINKKVIFDIIDFSIKKQYLKLFQISNNVKKNKDIATAWHFDEELCEVVIFAYNRNIEMSRETILARIRDFDLPVLNSILSRTQKSEYFQDAFIDLRITRASSQAIYEIIWEYFMEIGDEIMGIPEEDSLDVIFHMYVEEKLENLIFCAVNLHEYSRIDWKKVDAYCMENVPIIKDTLVRGSAEMKCYEKLILPLS